MKVKSFVTAGALMVLTASVPAFAADNYALDELHVDSGISTRDRAPMAGGGSADTPRERAAFQPGVLEQLHADSGLSTQYRPAAQPR